MTETKATCATCPLWAPVASESSGRCHHSASAVDTYKADDWWCNEHPDRKIPDVHELAQAAMEAMLSRIDIDDQEPHDIAQCAYQQADALVAEAKRRRGE